MYRLHFIHTLVNIGFFPLKTVQSLKFVYEYLHADRSLFTLDIYMLRVCFSPEIMHSEFYKDIKHF